MPGRLLKQGHLFTGWLSQNDPASQNCVLSKSPVGMKNSPILVAPIFAENHGETSFYWPDFWQDWALGLPGISVSPGKHEEMPKKWPGRSLRILIWLENPPTKILTALFSWSFLGIGWNWCFSSNTWTFSQGNKARDPAKMTLICSEWTYPFYQLVLYVSHFHSCRL